MSLHMRTMGMGALLSVAVHAGVAAAQSKRPPTRADSGEASRTLAGIVGDYSAHALEKEIELRVKHGLPVERLPDLSRAHAQRESTMARSIARRLDAVRADALSHDDWLTLETLRWEVLRSVEAERFYWLNFASITPYSTPLRIIQQLFAVHPLAKQSDRERYLRLLGSYPAFADSIRAGLEARRARGILLPRDEIDLIAPMVLSYAQPRGASPFSVAPTRLSDIDSAQAVEFRADVEGTVERSVNPALERLVAYLRGPYRLAAPTVVGVGRYPGGKEYYRYLVRLHTTLDVTPQEVHRTGLAEVARIDSAMAFIRKEIGFRGTKAEFHAQLSTDPRFFAKTPEEVGQRLMAHDARIQPLVPKFFSRIPRAIGDVRRLDPKLEPVMTFGYYQPPSAADSMGHYYYNGSRLSERSLLNAAALIYHELVPGHHFQFALQSENSALPPFRREAAYTAFVEGWGEYASSLAGEMGLYADPYDRYGRLMMDMFLSCRLVVDTGMNYFGWSRERAIAYMRENILESDTQLNTETLRYSVDLPGQALAYKMGSRKITELREYARQGMGNRFSIVSFHEAVLGSGAMPLSVLERHIERFVRGEWHVENRRRR